jgi:hypothetical protein
VVLRNHLGQVRVPDSTLTIFVKNTQSQTNTWLKPNDPEAKKQLNAIERLH